MVTRCLCDMEQGKYVFADSVEISVQGAGQVSLSPSHCVDLSLGFSLVRSEQSLSSHKVVTCGKNISHSGTTYLGI